jgi:O-methyltransferase
MAVAMNQGAWWAKYVSPDHAFGRALMAARTQVELARWRPASPSERELKSIIGRLSPAYTMIAVDRLQQLAAHAIELHRDGVEGSVVECGTWRGGALALVDWAFRMAGDPRSLWGFDSFEGLPPPTERDPESAHRGFFSGWCAASIADVHEAIRAAGGAPDRVNLVRGWLKDTLPGAATGPIALLHIDVDWYDSVRTVFDHLSVHIAAGGIVSVDDYGRWHGCNLAVDEFLDAHRWPRAILRPMGRHGVWFRVPSARP